MRNNGELAAALTHAQCGDQITASGSFSKKSTLVIGDQASTIRVGYTFDSYNTGLDATYPASNTSLVGNRGSAAASAPPGRPSQVAHSRRTG